MTNLKNPHFIKTIQLFNRHQNRIKQHIEVMAINQRKTVYKINY